MRPSGTLVLTRREVAALIDLDDCIAAVEQAFKMHAEGKTLPPGILGIHTEGGGFHIKAAGLKLSRTYFAVKVNGNFFENRVRFGMPNIQGVIMLCDGQNGYPLALMDSIEITIVRTGAATAVAAKYLARPDSKVATICGCGNQGKIQLRSIASVLKLERAFAFDTDAAAAERFARDLSTDLRIPIDVATDPGEAVRRSDVCVTCTPSRRYFLERSHVAAGTFIAAVGADSEDKQELEPELVASSKLVADILDQSASIGELHHAIEKGLMSKADAYGELSEIVSGAKPGRTSRQDVIIFDSTGTALQDAAAAAAVYERATARGIGQTIDLIGQ